MGPKWDKTNYIGCVPELLAAVASTVGLRIVDQYWQCPATGRERNAPERPPAADQSRLLWAVNKWQTELQRYVTKVVNNAGRSY